MPITLTELDQRKLDTLIESILNAYINKEVSFAQVREAIAAVVNAAAKDELSFRSWLEPERVAHWKDMCGTGGS